jgi:hypothetical protein
MELAANCDHLSAGLIVRSKLMHFWFLIHNLSEKLLKVLVRRAFPQRFFDVEFKVATQARTKFPFTGKPKLIATLAKVKVGESADKANSLRVTGTLIIDGRTIRSVLRIGNQGPEFRFDEALCFRNRKEILVLKDRLSTYRHQLDKAHQKLMKPSKSNKLGQLVFVPPAHQDCIKPNVAKAGLFSGLETGQGLFQKIPAGNCGVGFSFQRIKRDVKAGHSEPA